MNNIKDYQSNPFKLIFLGLNKLFTKNQNLSIIILILSMGASGGWLPIDLIQTFNISGGLSNLENMTIYKILLIILTIFLPIFIFLSTMYSGLSAYLITATINNKTADFKSAWKASLNKFWIILGVDLIVGLKVLGGLLLFIIPGIRAALRYNFVHILIFDKNLGVKQSINKSKQLSKNHLTEIMGVTFASSIIPIVGWLALMGGLSSLYIQLTFLKSSSFKKPPVHLLNYFVYLFILIPLIIVLTILIIIFALNN